MINSALPQLTPMRLMMKLKFRKERSSDCLTRTSKLTWCTRKEPTTRRPKLLRQCDSTNMHSRLLKIKRWLSVVVLRIQIATIRERKVATNKSSNILALKRTYKTKNANKKQETNHEERLTRVNITSIEPTACCRGNSSLYKCPPIIHY